MSDRVGEAVKWSVAALAMAVVLWVGVGLDQRPVLNPSAWRSQPASWVTVSGRVVSVQDHCIAVDHGDGTITIRLTDWSSSAKGALGIQNGDEALATGHLDGSFFRGHGVRADSLYVKRLKTRFHQNGLRDVGVTPPVPIGARPRFVLDGVIEQTEGRWFTLKTDIGAFSVDTTAMAYDPLDEQGHQQLDEGDVVRVSGPLDHEIRRRTLVVQVITRLTHWPRSG